MIIAAGVEVFRRNDGTYFGSVWKKNDDGKYADTVILNSLEMQNAIRELVAFLQSTSTFKNVERGEAEDNPDVERHSV